MSPKFLDRFRRDDGRLTPPTALAEGITSSPSAAWAWVVLPTRSTDELNTEHIFRLTADGASDLRRLLPHGADFHFKIQWGAWTGEDYVAEESARLGNRLTPGQESYIRLGGQRITDNRFPRRQVLLGIRLDSDAGPELPSQLRRTTRRVAGDAASIDDAAGVLTRSVAQARTWHERMAASSFQARPASVSELAWALRRDLRRTVSWLPEGPIAPPGQVARLVNGAYAVPQADHVQLATDQGTSYLRLLTAAQTGFPSSDMELPGSEWLKELSIGDDPDGFPAPPVEVSIRGRNLAGTDAAKQMREALALAKEQGREAAIGVAEEPPDEIIESRMVLTERIKQIRQGTVGMVSDNCVWIVEADTPAELDRRTHALIDHYGAHGIELWAPEHVQDVLYKESVLGDRLRFADCEQLRPMTTLVGGWFHGGSEIGSATGPVLGGNIGSTPSPFRTRLTDAQLDDETVTSVFVGRSRSGKSTAVMLSLLGELVYGAWGLLTDFKGDLAGLATVAESYGVPVTTVTTSQQASGSMCPFRYVADPSEAASRAVDNLLMMLRPGAADLAEPILRSAANAVAAGPDPAEMSTHAIIQSLLQAQVRLTDADDEPLPDAQRQLLGRELAELARDPLARPVAGPPVPGARGLPTGPGLVYMRFNDLRMPGRESPQATWKAGQRLSVMLVQAGFAYATYMAARVQGLPRVVALTELHLITGYDFGRELVGWLARMGAALDVNLLLDTQACGELVRIDGLVDQVSAVYAFRVDTDAEADAQALLLGLQPETTIRNRQKSWAAGQCEAKDRAGRIAPVQFDYLSADIAAALSTTPDRAETNWASSLDDDPAEDPAADPAADPAEDWADEDGDDGADVDAGLEAVPS